MSAKVIPIRQPTSFAAQIEELQRQILELQTELPDSSFQHELQRLQTALRNLQASPPTPNPFEAIVQPTPPDMRLTPHERAVWTTFFSYHKALLQYAGEVNRDQWLSMVDVAADITGAIYGGGHEIVPTFDPPTTHGLYGWNGTSQSWTLAVAPPTQTQGVLGYDAATGLWVPISGGGGGSTIPNPPAAGGPYGFNSDTNSWVLLANLQPPVSIPNGGTGATSATQAINNLGGPYAPIANPTGGQNNYAPLMGNPTGALPAAGQIGELIQAGSIGNMAIAISPEAGPLTWVTLAQTTITPGDWDIHADVYMNADAPPESSAVPNGFTVAYAQYSTVPPPAAPNIGSAYYFAMQANWDAVNSAVPTFAYATGVPVTMYLVACIYSGFPNDVGHLGIGVGWFNARRMS